MTSASVHRHNAATPMPRSSPLQQGSSVVPGILSFNEEIKPSSGCRNSDMVRHKANSFNYIHAPVLPLNSTTHNNEVTNHNSQVKEFGQNILNLTSRMYKKLLKK